jgi:hypothetical protein
VFEEKFQSFLAAGETIHWTGQPETSVIFHKEDFFVIPFTLMWGGFAIFWEAGVLGFWTDGKSVHAISLFMSLWGIPFVVIGQYMIWGRFFAAAWMKRRIYYALTNRRALVYQDWGSRKLIAAYLDQIPGIDRESNTRGIGTIRFGSISAGNFMATGGRRTQFDFSGLTNSDGVVVFRDIPNVDSVYQQVESLRAAQPQKDVFARV